MTMATEQTTTEHNAEAPRRATAKAPAPSADMMTASLSLCYASAMLSVMIDRFEGRSAELLQIFGGVAGTDVNTLHAILGQVDSAARIVNRE
jgi:hypothetical protein